MKKGSDFVHRSSLWVTIKASDRSDKIINIVKAMHGDFECAVVGEGELTGWFRITSGVVLGKAVSCLGSCSSLWLIW